jgi:HK97 family phage portal protein
MSLISRILAPVWPAAKAGPGGARSASAPTETALTEAGWHGFVVGNGAASRVKTLPPVTPTAAQRHATVFACCNVIAGDLGKIPLHVMQKDARGRWQTVREHPGEYLLNVESSPGVAAISARFAMVYAFALRGRSYAHAPRDARGDLMQIDTIESVSEMAAGRDRFYDFTDPDGVRRRVPARAMVHLRYMAADGWTGRSPIEVAAESMGLALAGQEAAARAASGRTSKAAVSMPDDFADDEAYQRSVERMRDSLTRDEGQIIILPGGSKIDRLDLSAADIQLLESRKFDREQIAAIYRMPPAYLQMLEHGVKANMEQQFIDYRTGCLTHWGALVERQAAMAILTPGERFDGLSLRHDYDALMQATTAEKYEALRKAVGGPFMTWKEARDLLDLPELAAGDAPYPPANMTDTGTGKPGAGGEA